MGLTDVAFQAQGDEHSSFPLRGLAAVQMTNDPTQLPHSSTGRGNLFDFVVRPQRRVVRRIFKAKLNGLVDSVESMLFLQCTLHEIYCGIDACAQELFDTLEHGRL